MGSQVNSNLGSQVNIQESKTSFCLRSVLVHRTWNAAPWEVRAPVRPGDMHHKEMVLHSSCRRHTPQITPIRACEKRCREVSQNYYHRINSARGINSYARDIKQGRKGRRSWHVCHIILQPPWFLLNSFSEQVRRPGAWKKPWFRKGGWCIQIQGVSRFTQI